MEWIQRHQVISPELEKLALCFRRYTTHISLERFLEKIGQLSAHIRTLIIEGEYKKVILKFSGVGGGLVDMSKSNFWVTMLFFGYLQDVIDDIEIPFVPEEKTLVIVPDDVSYSGTQYTTVMSNLLRTGDNSLIDYFIGIPYISKNAYEKIKKSKKNNSKIIFSTYSEEFLNIKQLIEKEGKKSSKNIIEIWRDNTDIDIKKHPIYFDHKLADMVSIYQDIYALGRPLHKKYCEKWGKISLINGCGIDQYDNIGCNDFYDLQREVGWEKICPVPFYKGIKYTFEGNEIARFDSIL